MITEVAPRRPRLEHVVLLGSADRDRLPIRQGGAAVGEARIDPRAEMSTSDPRPQAPDDVPLQALTAELTIVKDRLADELASGDYRPLPGRTARIARLRRHQHHLRHAIEQEE